MGEEFNNIYAERGMLYGNQEDLSSTPQEEYQQEEQVKAPRDPKEMGRAFTCR